MIPDELPRDLPSFLAEFGTDAQCRAYLFARRWPQGFCCQAAAMGGLPASAAADRGVRGLRQAAFAAGRDDLRADQDRPGALVSGDLAGDLEQRRHLGGGAAAADGLRQLPDRLVLAAQDPQGDGPAGRRPLAARVEADETLVGGAKPGKRGRGAAGKTVVAGAVEAGRARAVAVGSAGCGCRRWPTPRPRVWKVSSPAMWHRPPQSPPTAGKAMPDSTRPATTTSAINLTAGWGDAVLRLPAIHLVFGLAKRWLLGTHHGAVSNKHLQAYLDEYVFRLYGASGVKL